jgi:hypothetical protein
MQMDLGSKIGFISLKGRRGVEPYVSGVFQKFSAIFSKDFSERIGLSKHSPPFPFELLFGNRAQSLQPCHGARVLVIGKGAYRLVVASTTNLRLKPKILFFFLAACSIPNTRCLGPFNAFGLSLI